MAIPTVGSARPTVAGDDGVRRHRPQLGFEFLPCRGQEREGRRVRRHGTASATSSNSSTKQEVAGNNGSVDTLLPVCLYAMADWQEFCHVTAPPPIFEYC